MELDLSERYNDGLVPPPDLTGEPAPTQLQRPAWRPNPAQVEIARRQLARNIAILFLLVCACLAGLALILGWMP